MTEVDRGNDAFRREIREVAPQWSASAACEQIPDGVDDGRGREMDHAFLRPDPAQLAVTCEVAPEGAGIALELVEVAPHDVIAKCLDRRATQLVAPADREGHAVTGESRVVGLELDVGRRVVRIGIHRVRAVEQIGRREAQVVHDHARDARHLTTTLIMLIARSAPR